MKLPLFLLVLCTLSMGCVVGPDEVAAEKQAKKDSGEDQAKAAEMAAAAEKASAEQESAEKDTGLKTVSGTTESEAAGSSDGFQKTNNGLKYKIIEQGTGKRPNKNSTVLCHYRGWLDNGREFDSSYKSGQPVEFPLNGVIPGWTEGLQLIQEGGKMELEIPSRLGYGERGMPGAIPPNARLHFTIELIKVK